MDQIEKYELSNIAVAFIDDQEVVLEGFANYMQKQGAGHVEAFCLPSDLRSRMHSRQFDVFVVDVELPGTDTSELIDEIRQAQPEAKILVYTMHEEPWVVGKMAEKHVDGVIYKSGRLEQLKEAIITVAQGQRFFSMKFKKTLTAINIQKKLLTQREQEILKAITMGWSTKEIAQRLYLSEYTVENHRKALLRKLDAINTAQLIVKAIGAGYIEV